MGFLLQTCKCTVGSVNLSEFNFCHIISYHISHGFSKGCFRCCYKVTATPSSVKLCSELNAQ